MESRYQSGQSILEVILALAIFALFAATMVSLILGSFESLGRGSDYLAAAALADEALEAARSIRDGAWNELVFNQSAATSTSGEWQFVAEGTDEQIGKFHRVLTFSPVCRDGSLNLTVCPAGATDLYSRAAKAVVDWTTPAGTAAAVERQTLFTDWDSRDWLQTDWSGGSGQSVWSDATRYESDDSRVDVSTIGELKLREIPPVWSLFVDTGVETWNDLTCPSASNCWAGGNSGALASYNGSSWSESTIPSSANVLAIYALSASDIWAVGATGRLWHYNGSSWSLFTDTGNQTWNGVWMLSATDGFVVGSGGQIRRLVSGSWSSVPSGTGQNLNAIYCLSASDCWAVGASGVIVRWNGSSWSVYSSSPSSQNLNGLFILSPADGWAVGGSGNILRLAGGGYEMNGELVSSAFDLGDPSPVQIIEWDEQIPACSPVCSIKFQIRVAASQAALAGTPWSPDFTVSQGTLVNQSYNGQQWLQYRIQLVGDGNATPRLEEVRLNYK